MGKKNVGDLKGGESGQDSKSPMKMRPMNRKKEMKLFPSIIVVSWKKENSISGPVSKSSR